MERTDTVILWAARIAWLATASGTLAVGEATSGTSAGYGWVVSIVGYALFAVGVVALWVPSVWSLTIIRVVAPLSIVAAALAAIGGAGAASLGAFSAAAVISTVTVISPEVGRWMVQGSAYGDEERFPLRPPAAAGLAAIVSWVVWAAVVTAAVLLSADGRLAVGLPLVAVAVLATAALARRWNRLSRRWFVLVPAGVVDHDPVVLADTVMVPASQIRSLRLALADTGAADLTGPASGHAIEISTTEPTRAVFAFTPSEPNGRAIHMSSFLVAPSRPGRVLAAAQRRGLPVG